MPSIQWKLTSCRMVVMVVVMEKEGMMTGTVLDLFYKFNSFSPHKQHYEVLYYYYPHFSQEETVAHGG